MRPSIGCCRAVCVCFEQRLNQPNVCAVLEQMGGEGMAQRMKGERLAQPGGCERASVAGSMTGCWSLTSKVCSTIFRTIYY